MDVDGSSLEDTLIIGKKRKLSYEPDDGVADQTPTHLDLDDVQGHSVAKTRLQNGMTPELKRTKITDQSRDGAAVVKDRNRGVSALPPEVLQHILAYLDPLTLGRVLSVNRSFSALLDPRKTLPSSPKHGTLSIQDQDFVWRTSRRLHHPGFPRPLSSVIELEMWSLLRGTKCNFCERRTQKRPPALITSPWNAGPGLENVRVIWPFAIRSCGTCLQGRLIKESDLLFSSASALLPGIPFAYLTPSWHFVTSITLRNTSPPPTLHLTKYYYGPQVEDIKRKMQEVRTLGSAAAEEWYKGLESSGSDAVADAARFEHWEATGGYEALWRKPAKALPKAEVKTERSVDSDTSTTTHTGVFVPAQSVRSNVSSPFHSQLSGNSPRYPSPAPERGSFSGLPPKPVTPGLGAMPNNPFQQGLPPGVSVQSRTPQHRPARNLQDVMHMKAERRLEIERRCLLLSPPIRPSTLVHMDAFAAAIQITMPLNDAAWEVLKTHLLAQRAEAEQNEAQQRTANELLQSQTEGRRQQEEQSLAALQNVSRDWEELQKPVRKKLEGYADELIRSQWNNGDYVDKENAPQFAADVLLYVKKRFYEAWAQENGPRTPAHLHGQRTPVHPSQASDRVLKLENMRWVFEAKVKPITERFRREVFLCSVCDDHRKYYAFDAVIQHYAAKHTNALSSGTTVVYWKAEWPEDSPFDPEPTRKSGSRTVEYCPQASSPLYVAHRAQSQPREVNYEPYDRPPFHPSGVSPQFHAVPSLAANASELPAKGQVSQQESTAYFPATSPRYLNGQQTLHYAQGSGYVATSPQHQLAHQREAGPRSYSVVSNGLQNPFSTSPNPYSTHTQPVSGITNIQQPPTGPSYGIYHVQMEELARIAREVWDGTDGVKDFPSSLRIHVIIHHVALRFPERFTNEPTLALFIDALNNNSSMKPLKILGGLKCKACALQPREDTTQVDGRPILDNADSVYMLSELLKHFQSVHTETGRPRNISPTGIDLPRPDWKFDMVQLPDETTIKELMTAPGITYSKLRFVAMVLPQYFPHPLPEIQAVPVDEDSNLKPFLENGNMNPAIAETLHGLFDGSGRLKNFDRRLETSADHERRPTRPVERDEYHPHGPRPSYDYARRPEEVKYVPVYPIQERSNRIRPAYDDRYYEGARSSHVYEVDDGYTRMVLPEGVSLVRRPYESRYRYEDEYFPSRAVEPVRVQPARYYPVDEAREYSPVRRRPQSEEEDRLNAARQEPAIKSRPSPLPEAVNAAEHFLNTFDMVASAENVGSDPTTHSRETAERDQRLRETFPDPVEKASDGAGRLLDVQEVTDSVRSHANSHRGTPKTVIPPSEIRERSRSSSPRFRGAQEQDGEYDLRAPEAPSYPSALREHSHQPRDASSQPRQRSVVVEEISSYREPVEPRQPMIIEYDQNGLPTGDSHLVRAPVKRVYYRDRSPPQYHRRESYGPQSPPVVRRYPSDGYPRYVDTRSYGNYGYADDRGPVDASVEYVRVGPREAAGPGQGNYYVERPVVRDARAEFVEYNAPPPPPPPPRRDVREVREVYERDGRFYARPEPLPQEGRRFEPPYEPVRYR